MKKNSSSVRNFLRATRGANMVEYIILVGVVALLAVVGFKAFSGNIKTTVESQGKSVQNADNTFSKGN
jgi:pilus assembly protein Flp/PilA